MNLPETYGLWSMMLYGSETWAIIANEERRRILKLLSCDTMEERYGWTVNGIKRGSIGQNVREKNSMEWYQEKEKLDWIGYT